MGDRLTLETAERDLAEIDAVLAPSDSPAVPEWPAMRRLLVGLIEAYRERIPDADEDDDWPSLGQQRLSDAIRAAMHDFEDEYSHAALVEAWANMGRNSRTFAADQIARRVYASTTGERLPASDEDSDEEDDWTGNLMKMPGAGWGLDQDPDHGHRSVHYDQGKWRGPWRQSVEAAIADAWEHATRFERGPTEGASDAVDVEALLQVALELDAEPGEWDHLTNAIRAAVPSTRCAACSGKGGGSQDAGPWERCEVCKSRGWTPERPTGGASPETVEDIGRPLAGLGFEMTRKMAKAMHASPDRIADAASGLGVPASVYQAATELNASEHKRLMESLEAILADGPGLNVIGLERKLRAALDTAKGGERPGVDVGMRSMDDWRSDTAKGDDDPQDV